MAKMRFVSDQNKDKKLSIKENIHIRRYKFSRIEIFIYRFLILSIFMVLWLKWG